MEGTISENFITFCDLENDNKFKFVGSEEFYRAEFFCSGRGFTNLETGDFIGSPWEEEFEFNEEPVILIKEKFWMD